MTIPFANLPASTRGPGFYFEIDASKANTARPKLRALILGQATVAGLPQAAVLCPSTPFARSYAGAGSPLALMAAQYRRRDVFGEIWIAAPASNGAGTASTVATTFTGPATAAGTMSRYECGVLVQFLVSAGMTATQMAAAYATVVNANPDLPVTATASGAVVTCTAKVVGPLDLDSRTNYRGALGGEVYPAGTTATSVVALGTGAPDLTLLLANLGDRPFDMIVVPYADTTTLDAIKAFLSDSTGRWLPTRLLFGHGFAAVRGTLGAVTTLTTARNDQHMTIMPFNDSPTPTWLWAADIVGSIATSIRNDPGLPVQRLALGVLAPPAESRFVFSDRETLLYDGASTYEVDDDGTVRISRMTTTYQRNTVGVPDDAFLDVETPFQLAEVIRFFQADFSTVWARKKIVANGTRLGISNQDTLTPQIIEAHVLALYRQLEADGRVQDVANFKALLTVEIVGNGRVNILLPITLSNQLRIVAGLVQFRKP